MNKLWISDEQVMNKLWTSLEKVMNKSLKSHEQVMNKLRLINHEQGISNEQALNKCQQASHEKGMNKLWTSHEKDMNMSLEKCLTCSTVVDFLLIDFGGDCSSSCDKGEKSQLLF